MKYKYNNQWVDVNIKALDSMPIGVSLEFNGAKNKIPNGWLICDGSAISRTEYADLFNVIGITFGSGDGSTTFNLPNDSGRVSVGVDENDTDFNAVGKTGGSKYLQAHRHRTGAQANYYGAGPAGSETCQVLVDTTNGQETSETGTGNSGNLQPYIAKWKCIKAKNTTPTMASVVNATNNSTTDTYSCDYENKHYGGVVLYDNSTGTTSDVSLTMPTGETLSDYSYIEIYAITDDNEYFYTKAPSVVNRNVVIAMTHYYDNVVYTYVKSFKINASSLTINTTISGGGYYGGGMGVNNRDNISVVKVIGYK